MSKSARFVESLEGRQLLAAGPRVLTNVSADNRGEVQINLTEAVTNVSKKTVRMFLAGVDGIVGTADDVNANADVSYVSKRKRIVIKKDLPAGTGYRIRVDDSVVSVATGQKLDGEFHAKSKSGDGVAGGSYSIQVKNDRGLTPKVIMYSTEGQIIYQTRKDVAPITANNFIAYVDAGKYNNMFFTRAVSTFDGTSNRPFVLQGGSLVIDSPGTSAADVSAPSAFAPIIDENPGGISNTLGTVSFAKGSANGATNQFFVNLGDNSVLDSKTDPNYSGGFTVGAQVISGLDVITAIFNKPHANLSSQIGTVASGAFTGVTDVPVQNATQATAGLNPVRDLPYVAKAALLMRIYAV
ncbi:MAG: peptidylprolyl isomerase [Tepidisphaeraceae bacterium]